MEIIMTIANTFEYYTGSLQIAAKNSFNDSLQNYWPGHYYDVDISVFADGLDYLSPLSDAQAVQYRMEVWRLFNDYRGYLRENADAEVDGALDSWLVPQLEKILKVTNINIDDNLLIKQNNLYQNYPNPFNTIKTISSQLHHTCKVNLIVF